ncbi:MAG: STM4014 family protein [Verrucomicrobiota bacterium]
MALDRNQPFLLIANPENRRATYFGAACRKLSLPQPKIHSWDELVAGRWPEPLSGPVRIESPGERFSVERGLIVRGGETSAVRLMEEPGRIRYQPEWYAGWLSLLRELESRGREARFMNSPAEIALMFDKWRCQEALEKAVPVPERIGRFRTFDELIALMETRGAHRVFVKPRHGSSASGVVALERAGARIRATTSVRMERQVGGETHLFNVLRMQRYEALEEVRQLIDALGGQNLFAERWFPKARLDQRSFDLRVVVIAGRAGHVVMRTSRSPITNLHLGNARGDLPALKALMGPEKWNGVMDVCQAAAGVFPGSHYVSVDLMISPGFERFAVAEVNAFGDLLPNVLVGGMDTYTEELASFF